MQHDDGMKKFLPGSIIRVRMKGFLTYQTDTTVRPGPRLNMVVGPNGTGKSSIVCAICIGLNGRPELLGRSSNLYDFITRGEEKGFIELELQAYDDATNPVVRREMERVTVDGRLKVVSKWSIDGKSATAKTVTELTQKYGIQLDNLCQFLPQDQVDSFSKMTPTEMLVETQKALGTEGAQLHAQQMELIKLQKEEKEQFTNVDAKKQRHTQLEGEVANLERLCGKQEEREQHVQRARLLRGALLWRQFDEKRAQGLELREAKKEVEKNLKEAQNDAKQKHKPWQQAKTHLEKANQGAQECKMVAKRAMQQAMKARKAVSQQEELLDETVSQFDSLQTAQANIVRKIAQAEKSVNDIHEKLDSLPPLEELKADYSRAKEPLNALKRELNGKMKEKDEAGDARQNASADVKRVQRLLGSLSTQDKQKRDRFMRVENRNNAGIKALKLRDELKQALSEGRLKMPCFGPLLFEMAVKDSAAQYASFVETHLPRNMRCAFVAQCPQDREFLHSLKRKIGANVTVLTCFEGGDVRKREDKAGDEAQSGGSRQHNIVYRNYTDAQVAKMQQYGVVDTLDKLLDVDRVVWLTLCQHCGFHNALAGNAETERALNQRGSAFSKLLMSCGTSVLYTPHAKYSSSRSLYSSNVATQTSAVQQAQMLGGRNDASDSSRRAELERDLQKRLGAQEQANSAFTVATEAAKDVQRQIAKIDSDVQGYRALIVKHNAMQSRLQLTQEKIEKLENDRDRDFSKDIEKNEKKIAMAKRKLINKIAEMQKALDAAAKAHMEQGVTAFKIEEHMAREKRTHAAFNAAHQRYSQLDAEQQDMEARFKAVLKEAKELKATAKRDAPKKDESGQLTELGRALDKDQSSTSQEPGTALNQRTADDIEEEMLSEERQADSIAANPEVVERYREKKTQCEALKAELENMERRHTERVQRLDGLKTTWQRGIEPVVHKIDASFSNFFQKFGCRGEVRLDTNEGRDVKDWTIDIMVEFRSGTGLRVLDPMVNSGGERTVSTILYLMALQSLTDVPFRVVDEINQGMDANNERLVFERIADECCRPGRAQYFLITPKLLTGLRYPPCGGVNVMFILNGAHNMNQRNLDRAVGKLLALMRPQSDTLGKRKQRPAIVAGDD